MEASPDLVNMLVPSTVTVPFAPAGLKFTAKNAVNEKMNTSASASIENFILIFFITYSDTVISYLPYLRNIFFILQ